VKASDTKRDNICYRCPTLPIRGAKLYLQCVAFLTAFPLYSSFPKFVVQILKGLCLIAIPAISNEKLAVLLVDFALTVINLEHCIACGIAPNDRHLIYSKCLIDLLYVVYAWQIPLSLGVSCTGLLT
jgi:hypothetical protein